MAWKCNLEQNEGNLVVEFAWKIPGEVGEVLEDLGDEFGSPLTGFEDTLRDGGYRSMLPHLFVD